VIDTGLGISAKDQANLFKPFFKSVDAQSKLLNTESNGLGLSICKKIAKQLGGDLVYRP
jgi:signal transduction histidine kinase